MVKNLVTTKVSPLEVKPRRNTRPTDFKAIDYYQGLPLDNHQKRSIPKVITRFPHQGSSPEVKYMDQYQDLP